MTTAQITPLQTRRADRIASALGAACILVAVAAAVVLVVAEAFPPSSTKVALTCCSGYLEGAPADASAATEPVTQLL